MWVSLDGAMSQSACTTIYFSCYIDLLWLVARMNGGVCGCVQEHDMRLGGAHDAAGGGAAGG